MKSEIEKTLAHKNWTGLTLNELIEAGRVLPSDEKSIMQFIKSALGEVESIQTLRQYKEIALEIASLERGVA